MDSTRLLLWAGLLTGCPVCLPQ